MLIAIDGLDGSGKNTQSRLLYESLRKTSPGARLVSFPTYDDTGSALVKLYLDGGLGSDPGDTNAYAASSFFTMDRYVSYRRDWGRAYESGVPVIADRYTTANAVHQLSKLHKSEWDSFLAWLWDFEFVKIGLPEPGLVIYLEMLPEISIRIIDERSRKTGRAKDIHELDRDYLFRSYEAALYASEKLGWTRVRAYENDQPRERRSVHNDILNIVFSALGSSENPSNV